MKAISVFQQKRGAINKKGGCIILMGSFIGQSWSVKILVLLLFTI